MQSNPNATSVQIFKNPAFGEIRTAGTSEQPLFCLADVCKPLGLSPKGVNQRLSDEVISNYPIIDKLGRRQTAIFINEDGLCDVILDSRKPEARMFRKWVTSEVLPAIRRTGGYMAANPNETPEQIMARALIIAQNTLEQLNCRAQTTPNAPAIAAASNKKIERTNIQPVILRGHKEFAAAFGISDRRRQANLRTKGMPCFLDGRIYCYNIAKVLAWLEENYSLNIKK